MQGAEDSALTSLWRLFPGEKASGTHKKRVKKGIAWRLPSVELLNPGAGQKKGIFALTHAVRATKPCLLSGLGAAALPSSKQVARAPGSGCLVNVSTLKLVALFS